MVILNPKAFEPVDRAHDLGSITHLKFQKPCQISLGVAAIKSNDAVAIRSGDQPKPLAPIEQT